jgi:hypothetical protein
MPTKRKPAAPEQQQIHPHYSYRVGSDVSISVIGLGPSQQRKAIELGELPQPVKLTASGRSRAWTGQQLIDIQNRRLAEAEAEQRKRLQARRGRESVKAEASAS